MPLKFAIAPINWSNDDDPKLGANIPLQQCLDEMKRSGYVGCELGHKFPKNLRNLKKNLSCFGLAASSDWIGTELSVKGRYQSTIADFKTKVDFLKELDVQALKVCECGHSIQQSAKPIFRTKVKFSPQQWHLVIDGLHQMGEIARKAGMFVSYHQHLGTGIESEEALEHLMANTDPELVSLLPDTGHLLAAGMDPYEVIARYQNRIKYIHLKDVRKDIFAIAKENDYSFMDAVRAGLFTVPGDGMIKFEPIFKLIKKIGYDGWLVVEAEQDPKKAPPYLFAQKARQFLRHHFLC